MDFTTLTHKDLEEQVIRKAELQRLYEIDVYLENLIGKAYVDLENTRENVRKTVIKSELSWATNLQEICKKRQHDVREDNNNFNWRFRVEAQKMLLPETYNQIAECAKKYA
jgi:hypothetical protein